ncbi:MAG: hypothetical protein ACRCWB_11755 [Enterovibrio sp.]
MKRKMYTAYNAEFNILCENAYPCTKELLEVEFGVLSGNKGEIIGLGWQVVEFECMDAAGLIE